MNLKEFDVMAIPAALIAELQKGAEEYEKTGRYYADEKREKPSAKELRKTARYYGLPVAVGIERLEFENDINDGFEVKISAILAMILEGCERDAAVGGGVILEAKKRRDITHAVAGDLKKKFVAAMRKALQESFAKE